MGVLSRGTRNAFRNGIRTISITAILALSIAMSLIMLLSLKTVDTKIASVKSSIGNTITVSPAGVRGFEGGGTLLTDQNAVDVKNLPNVTQVVSALSDRLTNGTNTNLTSAIDAGSFGNRQRQQSAGNSGSTSNTPARTFTMPVVVSGTNNLDSLASLSVSSLNITSGAKFDANSSDNIAMIGTALATKNNLAVDSTFQAYSKDIKIVGIFDAGNNFANAQVVMPIKTLQNISTQSGQVNSLIVTADSVDNMSAVTEAIKTKLGDTADVVSAQDQSQNAITPLENIKTISLYSLIGSLVAGSIIIFLTMVMIVRERRREIGVLKAIGSSNANIATQFVFESLILTLMSSAVGIILGFIFSNPVLKILVSNSQSTTQEGVRTIGGGGAGAAIARFGGGAQNALRDIRAVVGWEIILYGLGAAIIIAIIGSVVPSFLISKIRPAEVMRNE